MLAWDENPRLFSATPTSRRKPLSHSAHQVICVLITSLLSTNQKTELRFLLQANFLKVPGFLFSSSFHFHFSLFFFYFLFLFFLSFYLKFIEKEEEKHFHACLKIASPPSFAAATDSFRFQFQTILCQAQLVEKEFLHLT